MTELASASVILTTSVTLQKISLFSEFCLWYKFNCSMCVWIILPLSLQGQITATLMLRWLYRRKRLWKKWMETSQMMLYSVFCLLMHCW
jgi:hypothetical protein